ncbi:unnamed protein product [Sphagnum troendelagicum]
MGGGFDDVKEGIMTFSWLHHHVNGEVINNPDPMGSEVELVKRVSGAQLFLVDVEESVLMQCGEFSLRLLKQTHSPLAAVLASVGEVQWPVGKDAPILKVWNRRYTFALPGLVYGLSFPDSTPPAVLQQLESVMDQYCTFEIHQVAAHEQQTMNIATNVKIGQRVAGDAAIIGKYWTAVAPDVQTTSASIARQICSTSSIVADSILMGGDWVSLSIQQAGGAAAYVMKSKVVGDQMQNPRILKRIQQARRMSAVAKLMSKTLLKGAIRVSAHVATGLGLDHHQANANTSTIRTSTSAGSAAAAAGGGGSRKHPSVAVASVDAFAKVVEAVETAGKSVYAATKAVGTDLVQQRFGTDAGELVQDGFGVVGNAIDTAWTLNKLGLKMLFQVTAASTMLSSTSTRTKSSTTKSSAAKSRSSTTTTTIDHHNVQQQQQQQQRPPAAASMDHDLQCPYTNSTAISDQQTTLGISQQQTTLQDSQTHDQLQDQEMVDAQCFNLFPSEYLHHQRSSQHATAPASTQKMPQTQIFLGPATATIQQQPASVGINSFAPSPAAAVESYYTSSSAQSPDSLQSNSAFEQYKPLFQK